MRPIDDLIGLTLGAVDHRLKHQVEIDHRHAPDRGFDRAALHRAAREVIWRAIFCACADAIAQIKLSIVNTVLRTGMALRFRCAFGSL